MKKALLCITAILLLFANLVSCNSSPQSSDTEAPYESYVHSTSSSIQNRGIRIEAKHWWGGTFDNRPLIKRKTFTWDGVDYKAKYVNSEVCAPNEYRTDYYATESGTKIGVNAETKDIVFIDFLTKDTRLAWFDAEPIEDPQGFAVKKATEYLESQSRNIDDYELIIKKPVTMREEFDGIEKTYSIYGVEFKKKMLKNYHFPDYITVRVTSSGDLVSLQISNLGEYDSVQDFDETRAYESIDQKLHTIYANVGYNVSSYKFEKIIICKTPAHYYSLYSNIRVELEKDGETYTVLVSLITNLNKEL